MQSVTCRRFARVSCRHKRKQEKFRYVIKFSGWKIPLQALTVRWRMECADRALRGRCYVTHGRYVAIRETECHGV